MQYHIFPALCGYMVHPDFGDIDRMVCPLLLPDLLWELKILTQHNNGEQNETNFQNTFCGNVASDIDRM